jgi:hypothetical protein
MAPGKKARLNPFQSTEFGCDPETFFLELWFFKRIQGLKTNSILGASLSIFVPTVNEQ